MKKIKLNPIAGLISCLVITASSASAAAVIPLAFNGTAIDTTSGFNLVNSTTDTALNDVAWSDGVTGTSGIVDISFRVTASNTIVGRSATGGIGNATGTLAGNAGTITINNLALTSVSGDSFTVDGFTSLTFVSTGAHGIYKITAPTAGSNVAITGSGSYAITPDPATVFYYDANAASTLSFTGAGIQITGIAPVPEPSAALLGGLGLLALLRRRRVS